VSESWKGQGVWVTCGRNGGCLKEVDEFEGNGVERTARLHMEWN